MAQRFERCIAGRGSERRNVSLPKHVTMIGRASKHSNGPPRGTKSCAELLNIRIGSIRNIIWPTVKSDRMSMAHSVEVRPPFLDHRIVEFAAKLPADLKIRGSQQKLVLSELRKDKLPASILAGKKTGFDIPALE